LRGDWARKPIDTVSLAGLVLSLVAALLPDEVPHAARVSVRAVTAEVRGILVRMVTLSTARQAGQGMS
jgi:hypothetical protein